MQTFDKEVKVGKTQRYTWNVESFLGGDTLTSASVASELGLVTLSPCDIDGANISWFATGVSIGRDKLHVSYGTATQSDCDPLGVFVEEC